jgi:hypothetical protein
MAFSPAHGTGVAILSNTGISVDELGQRLMIGT